MATTPTTGDDFMPNAADTTYLYEGLYLINQQEMAGDLAGAIQTIRAMLDRAGAEVISLRKWDERKLAYPVDGQKRGLYILGLFRVRPVQIANIERDCNLSELVMRAMMIRADHVGDVEIEEELKDALTAADESKLKADAPGDDSADEDRVDEDAVEEEEANV